MTCTLELGFLEQLNGQTKEAAEEYRVALESDAYDSTAAGDLALIEAQHGNVPEAIRLWRAVFEQIPPKSRQAKTWPSWNAPKGTAPLRKRL